MKIYDAHAHVGIDYFYHNIKHDLEFNFPLKKLAQLMKENGVGKSIVSQCPSVKEITCCSPTDLITNNKEISSRCPKCKKTVSVLDSDPYREYNVQLAREIKEQKLGNKIIPFFVVHLQNPFFRREIDFYSEHYDKFGIKLHTYASKRSVLDVASHMRDLDLPVLIHTGPEDFTNPRNVIEFARGYSGNVLMAHAARLSKKYLGEINSVENLFVDVTPLTSFYNRIRAGDFSTILEDEKNLRKINSPEDIYNFLLDNVSHKKLLFGTDVPWCNRFGLSYKTEVDILRNLNIDKKIKEYLAFRNFETFLN